MKTYSAWRRALREAYPGFTLDGDKDIAQAFDANGKPCGAWDGANGEVNDVRAAAQPAARGIDLI
jgi:hypothetical protein